MHDIFLSHRRTDRDRIDWTRDKFMRPLRSFLYENMGQVKIFFDEQIETGSQWPVELGNALATSKILIPLLSPAYFYSDWCRMEFSLMHHRFETFGGRLIFPIIIEDGDRFEPKVLAIQSQRIHDYSNPWLCINTPKYEEFTEKIRSWVPSISAAIQSAPAFDPSWGQFHRSQFEHLFILNTPTQRTVPNIGT